MVLLDIILQSKILTGSDVPTIPASDDFSTWVQTDIAKGSFAINKDSDKVWTRTDSGIIELSKSSDLSAYVQKNAYDAGTFLYATLDNTPEAKSVSQVKSILSLNNLDNTTDAAKPVSTAQAAAIAVVQSDIDTHEANISNPHSVTKAQVGLGSVDNTSDANKPVSAATQTALNLKEDKANKNTVNGYPGLDGSGKINPSQLPALAISDYLGNFTSTTTALADAVVQASQKGDWFTVNTSGGLTYIVITTAPTTTGDIQLIKTPTDLVSSVFGRTGAVTAQSGDYIVGQITGAEASINKDASGGYAGLTSLKLNLRNALNTITSFFTNAATTARTWTMPDKDGTVAMLSDIVDTNLSNTDQVIPISTDRLISFADDNASTTLGLKNSTKHTWKGRGDGKLLLMGNSFDGVDWQVGDASNQLNTITWYLAQTQNFGIYRNGNQYISVSGGGFIVYSTANAAKFINLTDGVIQTRTPNTALSMENLAGSDVIGGDTRGGFYVRAPGGSIRVPLSAAGGYFSNNCFVDPILFGALSAVNPSATVEMRDATKGFLPNRGTNAQRLAISVTASEVGLEFYQTDIVGLSLEGKYIYKSTGWSFLG